MFSTECQRLSGGLPRLLPPLLYMLAIFGLSSVPGVIPEDAPTPYPIFN